MITYTIEVSYNANDPQSILDAVAEARRSIGVLDRLAYEVATAILSEWAKTVTLQGQPSDWIISMVENATTWTARNWRNPRTIKVWWSPSYAWQAQCEDDAGAVIAKTREHRSPAEALEYLVLAIDGQATECALSAERLAKLAANLRQSPARPDYLTPGASELACPQCGCVVYWQMHEVNDGAEGSAHCSRSSYTARAPSMPMIGDGGCEWHGRVRRVGGRVEVVA